ncbi:MAG: sn-glycerol-3-phosphate ABC transporter ATP-binding protein UgpC [Victivallaceae bacterium]|nr:sn-glycerol-3-phosphate ABC transporter ATP-binding protein UgpC [Victivallaceae bacterium]
MAEVILENVNKVYDGGVAAVRNLNMVIKDHEFRVLVGPSGCGKSTTLRMIAGLEECTSGVIRIGGRVVNDVPPKDRDIAMVFQNYALYPHMTVYENMAFGLKLRGFAKNDIDRRVRDAAEVLNIADVLDRLPKQLSGGQKQRVAVGRAIVRKPAAFLFDEPLSNLDAKMRVQMRTEIARLHQHLETTMIYVTHDQSEAMTMGDRISVMDSGVVQQTAEPLDLYDRPCNKFVAGFIGTPPMNFFAGCITSGDGKARFVGGGFDFLLPAAWCARVEPGQKVFFGVRPEDFGNQEAESDPAAPRITATVEVIEPMGSEMLAYLSADNHSFIARLDPHRRIQVGEELSMPALLDNAHFFDGESENTLI